MSNRKRFAHMSSFHRFLAIFAVLVVSGTFVALAVITRAAELEDGVEVEKNSELTYYLHVKYDGVDVGGHESSDNVTAEVFSDSITVTDVLPKGLTFKGFVTTADGKIGSVERKKENPQPCAGNVVDDTPTDPFDVGVWDDENHFHYHGLHYDKSTRLVTFQVRRLKAGCVLDVGIITQTPATVDDPDTPDTEYRRDFYNTAIAREGDITARSNTVHVWMGSLVEVQHEVSYSYTGTAPTGAPAVPAAANYNEGASVLVEPAPQMDGYTFSGWSISTPNGLTITNGVFDMPNSDVELVGTWTANPTPDEYDVIYHIYGKDSDEEDLPSWVKLDGGGTVVPKTHSYEEGDTVVVDSTEAGNYDGYQFSGWYLCPQTNEVYFECDIDDLVELGPDFVMPDHDVHIIGYYDRIKYKVTYQFEGSVMPDLTPAQLAALLPPVAEYYPGETVTTAAKPTATGYRFLGWYKGETFKMPEEDVVIYGEWAIEHGTFQPTISKENLNPSTVYDTGDTTQFKITLCNTASYAIHDVILQEQLEYAKFVDGATSNLENVELETTLPADSILKIMSIPANSCAIVYSTYVVQEKTSGTYTNTVEMIGALADDYNNLDTTQDYTATADYIVNGNDPGDPDTGVVVKNTFVFIGLVVITVIGGSVVILNRKRA